MKTYQERAWAIALFLVVAAITSQGVAAEWNPLLPGVGENDPRVLVDESREPWISLVKVQTNLGTRCTGALVAPRRVVTAHHCVLNRALQTLPPSSLHVLFGFERGEYRAHRGVASLVVGGPFDRLKSATGMARDWAVLTLDGDAPEGVKPLALAIDPPKGGTAAMLGGYSMDRAQVLTADTRCSVVGRESAGRDGLLIHNCAGTHGVSGAALLVRVANGAANGSANGATNGATNWGERDPASAWAVAGIATVVMNAPVRINIAVPAVAFASAVGASSSSSR